MAFTTSAFFPAALYREITNTRVSKPELIAAAAERRVKPDELTYDGKLSLLLVDQPARRLTAADGDPIALGDRFELLGRALRVLSSEFDGVVTTVDVMEELLILDQLIVDEGGESVIDDTLLIAAVNPGGLAGSAWELSDRFTSFSSESVARLRLDGVFARLRLDAENKDAGDLLSSIGAAVEEVDRIGHNIPLLLAPLPVRRGPGGIEPLLRAEELVKMAGVASALGSTSMHTWLAMPPVEDLAWVARATTLPMLMLGGDAGDATPAMLASFAAGMQAGDNVRGIMAGASVMFPPDGEDPVVVAHAIERVLRDGLDAGAAWAQAAEVRGSDAEWLNKLFPQAGGRKEPRSA